MDAELRVDGLGPSKAVLVVEGPDDKRVFARHVADPAQILPAGGRRILLSAHESANDTQRQKIIFVTDCDYEVRRGSLRGAPDLVITTFTDMESDLLALGLVESVVLELVPRALESRAACNQISTRIRTRAEQLALPLGRLRMAAQPLGIPLNLDDIKLSRYWDPKTGSVNLTRLVDAMHSKVSSIIDFNGWRKLIADAPEDIGMCHGKDLVRALAFLLKSEYRVDGASVELVARIIRASLAGHHLESWEVIRRIKMWQEMNRRYVLTA
ncbi:hypothetical protein AB0M19_20635 [Streptomyces sp. NPDC051920]|uniref:hypothetical protein n=1 Tax=Streptomyces sp. NPDC051920 TaxID=3155523 RepID=UPI00343982FB